MNQQLPHSVDLGPLSALAPELASTFACMGGDIALVIGDDGVIRNVAEGMGALASAVDTWVGRPWIETVTLETRRKVELLLQEVHSHGMARRREVNHPGPSGADIPVAYSAVRLGSHGPVLAVGRDLRAVAAIQQRFVAAQRDLEHDYWSRRQADARVRLLFQVLNDAVLLVDATTQQVIEANAAAEVLFGAKAGSLPGTPISDHVAPQARAALADLMTRAAMPGQVAAMRLRPTARQQAVDIDATPFVSDGRPLLLLRARDVGGAEATQSLPGDARRLLDFVQRTPDGVVITDSAGRVLMANPAFASLCDHPAQADLSGLPLDELLGESGGQWASLLQRARQRGVVIRAQLSVAAPEGVVVIDAAATLLVDGDQECVGFSLRRLHDASPAGAPTLDGELAASLAALAGQVGRLPLADMLTEVQFIAERHLVGHALRVAQGALEPAARALGLTPDGLELRLRRHRLWPQGPAPESPLLN